MYTCAHYSLSTGKYTPFTPIQHSLFSGLRSTSFLQALPFKSSGRPLSLCLRGSQSTSQRLVGSQNDNYPSYKNKCHHMILLIIFLFNVCSVTMFADEVIIDFTFTHHAFHQYICHAHLCLQNQVRWRGSSSSSSESSPSSYLQQVRWRW